MDEAVSRPSPMVVENDAAPEVAISVSEVDAQAEREDSQHADGMRKHNVSETKPDPRLPLVVGVLNGVRTISAVVVLFHHIGALDPDLWDQSYLASKQRRLASAPTSGSGPLYYLIGVGPGKIAVEVFLLLAGFVAAYPAFIKLGYPQTSVNQESKVASETESTTSGEQKAECSSSGDVILQRYQKLLLKRFWRLALPLAPVQFFHVLLWQNRLAFGPWLSFPSQKVVDKSLSVGVPAIWSSALSGSLWIVEALFFAPFVTLGVQLPVINCRANARVVWYLFCWLYFSGDFDSASNISSNTSVVIGVALADYYAHTRFATPSKARRTARTFFALALICAAWLPGSLYAHPYTMILSATGFVIFALYAPNWFALLLDNKLMSFSSRYSFQLYIWHLLVLSIFAVNVQPVASKPVLYISAFSSCFAVAILAYHIFELPSNQVSDAITRWFLNNSKKSISPRLVK